ncbi:glutamyl-tRNA reductase [Actinotalea sp.]|uniref:glutamyl-tRNA reductase n=1 Tax=Actinotalea sp. TaxID=1872145 RepID=UPI00356A82DD
MNLTASHHDLDLDVLEQLSSGAHAVAPRIVQDCPAVTGCIVLATCNRFELYLEVDGPSDAVDVAVEAIARESALDPEKVRTALRASAGHHAVRHLFAVAAGLDSMVIGEREVAGQVRRALVTAREAGTTSPALERLFQSASRVARTVGADTELGSTGRSVVGVALDLAEAELGRNGLDLATASVLLVGTGSYAGASVRALAGRGAHEVRVHSPSGRVPQLAALRGLPLVSAAALASTLAEVDVVVSCSGARGPVIDAAMVAAARGAGDPGSRPRPMVVLDLALRHDVDPAVARVPGVLLVDLAAVRDHSPTTVGPAVAAGLAIVDEHVTAFERATAEAAAGPAVVALRSHVEEILEVELARQGTRDEATVRALRHFAASLLHEPMVRARDLARSGREREFAAALEAVLGVRVAEAPRVET